MSITPRVCREDTDLIRSWSGSHQHLPGERCRRIVTRRGKLKALVAVARSILVILWQLLSHPGARYHDLGADYYTTRTDTERRTRKHVRQLQALDHEITLSAA